MAKLRVRKRLQDLYDAGITKEADLHRKSGVSYSTCYHILTRVKSGKPKIHGKEA
jgi:hypothetical protein